MRRRRRDDPRQPVPRRRRTAPRHRIRHRPGAGVRLRRSRRGQGHAVDPTIVARRGLAMRLAMRRSAAWTRVPCRASCCCAPSAATDAIMSEIRTHCWSDSMPSRRRSSTRPTRGPTPCSRGPAEPLIASVASSRISRRPSSPSWSGWPTPRQERLAQCPRRRPAGAGRAGAATKPQASLVLSDERPPSRTGGCRQAEDQALDEDGLHGASSRVTSSRWRLPAPPAPPWSRSATKLGAIVDGASTSSLSRSMPTRLVESGSIPPVSRILGIPAAAISRPYADVLGCEDDRAPHDGYLRRWPRCRPGSATAFATAVPRGRRASGAHHQQLRGGVRQPGRPGPRPSSATSARCGPWSCAEASSPPSATSSERRWP